MDPNPVKQFLIRLTNSDAWLKRLWINPKEVDQIFIKPDRDVVVVLNLSGIAQANLVDKPAQ